MYYTIQIKAYTWAHFSYLPINDFIKSRYLFFYPFLLYMCTAILQRVENKNNVQVVIVLYVSDMT